jgi:hypothetical protein
MTLKISTGLRNYLLDNGSVKDALDGGLIKQYSGPVPATADDALAVGNTLLRTISLTGTGAGISFDAAAVDGTLSKDPAEVWKGTIVATDTATFYRHVAVGDDGTLSTTQARIQGSIGVAGAEMNVSTVAFVTGVENTLNNYTLTLTTL